MLLRLLYAVAVLLLIGCAIQPSASTNAHGFYLPQNLTEATQQLDKVLAPKAVTKFRQLKESDLQYVYLPLLNEWEDSRFSLYLNAYVQEQRKQWGFTDWQARKHLVLLAYLRYLNKQPFDVAVEARKFYAEGDSLLQQEERMRQVNIRADSIDGVYIPRNLAESFIQLDRLLPDTLKQRFKQQDPQYGLAEFHFGLGRWMRNNWQLWGGSRLQLYLAERGVVHPDDMSGVILTAYSEYLNGRPIEVETLAARYADKPDSSSLHLDSTTSEAQRKPTPLGKEKRKDYSKEYRRFLRTRRINDFHALPPEAYGTPVEVEMVK